MELFLQWTAFFGSPAMFIMYIHLLSSSLEHDDVTLHSTLHFQSNCSIHVNAEKHKCTYARQNIVMIMKTEDVYGKRLYGLYKLSCTLSPTPLVFSSKRPCFWADRLRLLYVMFVQNNFAFSADFITTQLWMYLFNFLRNLSLLRYFWIVVCSLGDNQWQSFIIQNSKDSYATILASLKIRVNNL